MIFIHINNRLSQYLVFLLLIFSQISAIAADSNYFSLVDEKKPEAVLKNKNQTYIGESENQPTKLPIDEVAKEVEIVDSPSNLTAPKAQFVVTHPSFANIVEPLMPAVVNIYTVQYNKKNQYPPKAPFPEGFPFDQFNDFFEQFNIPFNSEELYSNPKAVSLGSGFIIDQAGFIVTNHHVVSNADEIHIKLIDNTELPAKLIGTDQRTDLALLKVESKQSLPNVKFGNSSKSRVGDWVIAIGNPFGLGGTVTTGIISSKGRDIDINTGGVVDDFIQTDAAINSGNSGGPMFNLDGEVIGVNTAIFSPSGTNIGIGFSIPSNTAQTIIEQLKKSGKISRGRLDVTVQEITTDIAEALGLKEANGALVAEVIAGGAADIAGIKSGDIIIEFAGQSVKNSRKLQVLVAETPVDKEVPVVIMRGGKIHNLHVKITEVDRVGNKLANFDHKNHKQHSSLDTIEKNHITFSNLTDAIREKFAIKEGINGVIITNIDKDQRNYGLKVGDIVMAINQQYINNVEQLHKYYDNAKADKKQNIVLLIKRRNIDIFIAIPIA
ncbi:Do family serine endopeptidase [Candidatus Trichorickettsia mobilis]|uniref:Do family serine endopeptidase n=1 Tax=Candidatus Trichorickettsia mobilis TaxID=1346319 RepID=UPI00292EA7A0|nr:Do family serine endopeptidase [Candidatus Trichorickettsia mobilis]